MIGRGAIGGGKRIAIDAECGGPAVQLPFSFQPHWTQGRIPLYLVGRDRSLELQMTTGVIELDVRIEHGEAADDGKTTAASDSRRIAPPVGMTCGIAGQMQGNPLYLELLNSDWSAEPGWPYDKSDSADLRR